MDDRIIKQNDSTPPAEPTPRTKHRRWVAQVDFWESVKEFILQRGKPGLNDSLEKLY